MFERMELAESVYDGVVESSYKKLTSTYANSASHRRKMRRETIFSTIHSETSQSSCRRIKTYVDHPKDRSKHTCLIHGTGHSSDEFKVQGDLGSKYSKGRSTKDRVHETASNEEI